MGIYPKTDCVVTIQNNTSWDMVIDIDDNDDVDWMDGPRTVLNGKTIRANNPASTFTLRSKDARTRCWFQMNNKFNDPSKVNSEDGYFHIGMTHIELKTTDRDKQARKGTYTEFYTQFKIKVTIDMETPEHGAYRLNIKYEPM